MPSFSRDDLRLFVLTASDGLRFLVAEFIDVYDTWSMGFFRFAGDKYVLTNLPSGHSASYELCEELWESLETNDRPLLTVPGGYYCGDEYHTVKGMAEDFTVMQGEVIDEFVATDGNLYTLIVSQQGIERVAYIGQYAATINADTPHEYELWRPTPVPQSLLNDVDEMLGIYGAAAMAQADFMEFAARLN